MISKNRIKTIEHFVVISLTSIMFDIMFDRKIFGTSSEIFRNLRKSSEVFGNLRKILENVQRVSY